MISLSRISVFHFQPNRQFIVSLVFGLLLAQWLVLTHVHEQTNSTPDSLCSVCLTGEQFNHVVGSSLAPISQQVVPQFVLVVVSDYFTQLFLSAYQSRAPPQLLN